MPEQNITISAAYVDAPKYNLSVTSGTGAGEYFPYEQVSITAADPAPGMIFRRWIGDTEYLASVDGPDTVVIMPEGNVNIEATYVDASSINNTLFAYEDFSAGSTGNFYPYPSGTISTDSWDEATGAQGRGYRIENSDPLIYPNLASTPKYVTGGNAYKSIEIKLDVAPDGVFNAPPDFVDSQRYIGYNGSAASTMYVSFLARPTLTPWSNLEFSFVDPFDIGFFLGILLMQ